MNIPVPVPDGFRRAVGPALRRVRMLRADKALVDGNEAAPSGGPATLSPEFRDLPPVVADVAWTLYGRWYTNPVPRHQSPMDDTLQRLRFGQALAGANRARWSWSHGWTLVAEEGAARRVRAPDGREQVVEARQFDGPEPSGLGRVAGPASVRNQSGAWFYAMGEETLPVTPTPLVRLYWSVCAEGALPLLSAVTQRLNEYRVPHQFKLLADPQSYGRADAGVLYLPTYVWERAKAHVAVVHERAAPWLQAQVPMLAKRLAPGLGLAEDPGGGASFGLHRCALLAAGLWAAKREGITGDEAILQRVAAQALDAGLDLERPHLLAAGRRDYELALRAPALPRLEEVAA